MKYNENIVSKRSNTKTKKDLNETNKFQVILYRRQRQSGFHCLILDLKSSNDFLLFIILGTKDHILVAK